MMRVLRRWTLGSFLLVAASLAACAGGRGTLLSVFRDQVVAASWTPSRPVEMYNRKNLFSLMNGQSETFFVYGFQLVALQTFRNAENTELGIQVWQVATPADAYGLFSSDASGAPAEIGNDGDADAEHRVHFWQDRYVVQVYARPGLRNADLMTIARAVSAALPTGGERPALVNRVPRQGLADRFPPFFHEELSIQRHLWLAVCRREKQFDQM